MTYLLWFTQFTSTALLLIYVVYSLLAWREARKTRSVLRDQPLQRPITFLIPGLNEASVIGQTIHNLLTLDQQVKVVFVDDASDDDSVSLVGALAEAHPGRLQLLTRHVPEARQGKGAALNWAVRRLYTRGWMDPQGLLAVFDADGRTSRALLIEAQQAFADPQVLAAQARIRIRVPSTGSWYERLALLNQDVEFFVVRAVQLLRSRFHFAGMGGNGQFFRWSYLQETLARGEDPWPHCLLEDFASGLKLGLSQPQAKQVFLESEVTQQGLTCPRKFIKQRARWALGGYQNLSQLKVILSSPHLLLGAKLDLSYFVLQLIVNALGLCFGVFYAGHFIYNFVTQNVELWTLPLYVLASLILPSLWIWLYAKENPARRPLAGLLIMTMPLYTSVMMLAVIKAWWQVLRRDFSWFKSPRLVEVPIQQA